MKIGVNLYVPKWQVFRYLGYSISKIWLVRSEI